MTRLGEQRAAPRRRPRVRGLLTGAAACLILLALAQPAATRVAAGAGLSPEAGVAVVLIAAALAVMVAGAAGAWMAARAGAGARPSRLAGAAGPTATFVILTVAGFRSGDAVTWSLASLAVAAAAAALGATAVTRRP
ncbi:MAG: hypothetical protein GEU81_01635 [Nitriliruptorales bacterium]|nr:hypothetical protein [Nitriliruptorales bacterium]